MTAERFGRMGIASLMTVACVVGFGLIGSAGVAQTAETDGLNPQIVRVSYVQGDVRVSRGAEHGKGATWEQAVVDLPVESGYSLVTGKGRAEIEFEDSSTVYLGENSVLMFTELSATDEAPYTALNLVSGTMTVHAKARFAGESFVVSTPSSGLRLQFGQQLYARLDSYLDATGITPQDDLKQNGIPYAKDGVKGVTLFYKGSNRLVGHTLPHADVGVAFDAWVTQRVAEREQTTAKVMAEAGLSAPVAGLAELSGQGKFFDCAPYGTCWEPTKGWDGKDEEASPAAPVAELARPAVAARHAGWMQVGYAMPQGQVGYGYGHLPGLIPVDEDPFPCSPYSTRSWYQRDPQTLKLRLIYQETFVTGFPNYNWAVCHAGSWVPHGRRYAWVVGTHRHHHCPVHWVKSGGRVGYVPVHPKDVAGKTPENLRHGMFVPVDRKAGSVERVAYSPGEGVKVLREAPREFRRPDVMPLQRAEAPVMMAHTLRNEVAGVRVGDGPKGVAGSTVVARESGTPIVFNPHRESFTINRPPSDGGHSVRGTETLPGRPAGGLVGFGGGGARAGSAGFSGGGVSGGGRVSSSGSSGGGGASSSSHASAPAASAPAASAPAPSAAPAAGGHK